MMTTSHNTRQELMALRLQWKPMLLATVAMMGLYLMAVNIAPGWFTYAVSAVALTIIAVTALVRTNDIPLHRIERRWHVRRFGLSLVGLASVWLLFPPMSGDFPTWKEVFIRWGFALTWITTPYMPPWWRYVTGAFRVPDPSTGKMRPWWAGITGTHDIENLQRALDRHHEDDNDEHQGHR